MISLNGMIFLPLNDKKEKALNTLIALRALTDLFTYLGSSVMFITSPKAARLSAVILNFKVTF